MTLVSAIRAYKATHILNDTEYPCVCFLAEVYFFSYVGESHLLWSGHYDCTENISLGQVLKSGYMLIGSAWRRVNDKVVEVFPHDIGEILADESIFLGSSPNDGIVTVG